MLTRIHRSIHGSLARRIGMLASALVLAVSPLCAQAQEAGSEWIMGKIPEPAKPAWTVKSITITNERGGHKFDMAQLLKIGEGITTGTHISTITAGDTEVWVELVNINGHDLIKMRPGSIVTMGDDDPETERLDIAILAGAIDIETSKHEPGESISVYAPHLVATIENSKCVVSTIPSRRG